VFADCHLNNWQASPKNFKLLGNDNGIG